VSALHPGDALPLDARSRGAPFTLIVDPSTKSAPADPGKLGRIVVVFQVLEQKGQIDMINDPRANIIGPQVEKAREARGLTKENRGDCGRH
jgi:hypothetical protein